MACICQSKTNSQFCVTPIIAAVQTKQKPPKNPKPESTPMFKDALSGQPVKGHTPKGAHGRAAVKALGRTKTSGNFKRIEKAKGKGAAIAAYQNALKAHKG